MSPEDQGPGDQPWASAAAIAGGVRSGGTTATAVVEAALARIDSRNPALNAFTEVTAQRALARAAAIDAVCRQGRAPGSLAGVPFAVKNLMDVAGLPTRAGSKINRDRPPATADATVVRRLEAAGAILVGTLNMGEYAYDFTGENVHDGPSRNPHDRSRMTGGSSGGSAAAVAGGLVPVALGSDTNGSIRVPAALCGLFGLVPTFGRLSRAGTFPFVARLDRVGPFARTVTDLALLYDAMAGHDAADPACRDQPAESLVDALHQEQPALRVAVAGGYFQRGASAEVLQALAACAETLSARGEIELPEAARARAAAYVITASEGAALHLARLRSRAAEFDPAVRDRLIAGALLPASLVIQARKLRRWLHAAWLKLFEEVDIILAPTVPCQAPLIGQKMLVLDGEELPVRANLGLYTQPVTFPGLTVVAVPVPTATLPVGVQVIAAPWQEAKAMRAALMLERAGVARAPQPP